VQGNLDPAAVVAGWPAARAATEQILRTAGGRPGHVFNLGHGVLPSTDPDVLARIVDTVHGWDPATAGTPDTGAAG
jgi:uroporphyrinogen decarboxylase